MHNVWFFPIGNADTCLIQLENGRRALFDFADMRNLDDADDKRCDLERELRACLGEDKELDVVAFTHLDTDHTKRSTELDTDHTKRSTEVFELHHADKYQGGDRIRIKTLWVPAAAILEAGVEGEARILRAEARHRLIKGEGIRVFSRPDQLDQFLKDNGIDPAQRRHLISDAGTLCPEFILETDGVEFFVHSPFAEHCDGELIVRNTTALFMQATFKVQERLTRLILSADVEHGLLDDIVRVTRFHGNDDRLIWDINNIPHHCSYLSLAEDKGEEKTEPSARLKWLYETQGTAWSLIVSTSDLIPDEETIQPPHREAAAYYKGVAAKKSGQFVVTMEHPTRTNPKPLVIEITNSGFTIKKVAGGSSTIIGGSAPRAGWTRKA
jgi:hypothetical protein